MSVVSKVETLGLHGSVECRSHTSKRLLVVMTISIIPISFQATFYIAELIFVALALCTIAPKAKLPTIPMLALLLALLSLGYFLAGLHGASELGALTGVRAMFDLAAFTFVLVNRPELATRLRDALPAFGSILTVLLALEYSGNLHWAGQTVGQAGFVGESFRVVGPLGPGPTSTILLCALYVSLRQGQTALALIASVGLMIPVSRAHYIAAVLMLVAMLASSIRTYVRSIVAIATLGALFVFFTEGVRARIVGIVVGGASEDRTVLWNLALEQFSPVGHGPAGFFFQETLTSSAAYPHNQYLVLLAYYGVVGVGFTVLFVLSLIKIAKPHQPLLVGLAAACVFGEFLVGPTPALCMGSIAAWIVFLSPTPVWSVGCRQPPRLGSSYD